MWLSDKLTDIIYSSNAYERFINFQNRTLGKLQTNLLKKPGYWKWHSLKYSNTVHWLTLAAFVVGIFIGIMSPFQARKQPGQGFEPTIINASSATSSATLSPNLVTTDEKTEIEIILKDKDENPIKEREIEIYSDNENVIFQKPTGETSINGVYYTTLYSPTPLTAEIYVRDLTTDQILDLNTEIVVSENEVQHWTKPGSILEESATSAAVDFAGNYKLWQTNAVGTEPNLEFKFEKENYTYDKCILSGLHFYCAGGVDQFGNNTDHFYKINSLTGENTRLKDLPVPVSSHELVAPDGEIWLIGGNFGNQPSNKVFKYSVSENNWEDITSLPNPIYNFSAKIIDEKIYLIGGYKGENQTNQLLTFVDGEWKELSGMGSHKNFHSSSLWRDRIIVFGGWDGTKVLNKVEMYIPESNNWYLISQMPKARWGHQTINFNEKIYVIGGYDSNGDYVSDIDIYDPSADYWYSLENLSIEKAYFSIASINSIFILGGDSTPAEIHELTPAQNLIQISSNQYIRKRGEPSTQFDIISPSAEGKIVTREIDNIDLSNLEEIKFNIYSTLAGIPISFIFGEIEPYENEFNVTIDNVETWQEVVIDISGIPAESKNNVNVIGIRIKDASNPFKFNIYDIWTEDSFYSECPCVRTIGNIFFEKKEGQVWGDTYHSALMGATSSVTLEYRLAGSLNALQNTNWASLDNTKTLEGQLPNILEIQAVLQDDENSTLPNLRSISIEVE